VTDPEIPGPESDGSFWDGFLLGLERGSASSYDAGYAEADENLRQAVAGFFQANPIRGVIRDMDAQAAREAARARPVDARTPQELRRDAYLSWGLEPPAELEQADHDNDELDDAAGL
jgi:hypothetical protein